MKPIARWDRFFHLIEENDPARHLKSIHNGEETMNYDHRKPWVDHVCIQNWNVKRTADWRATGASRLSTTNSNTKATSACLGRSHRAGTQHRFWITVTRGGYAGHGECLR